jgi:hypothetical protein
LPPRRDALNPEALARLPSIKTVAIDADLLAALERAPDKKNQGLKYEWTPEKDAILLKYWETRLHRDVCRVLRCSVNTAIDRFRLLTS